MKLSDVWGKIQAYTQVSESKSITLPSLAVVVEEARREWLNAQYYYNTVSDEDLVDHAVYLMQAAERKYIYLLKQARRAGVEYSPYMMPDHVENGKNEVITR